MPIHRIRLRKPWSCEPDGAALVWRRRFNRPTGVEPQQRVFLVIEGLTLPGTAALNGQTLGVLCTEPAPQRFEVTAGLRLHNELALRLESAPPADLATQSVPPAEICLEICSPDT